MPIAHGEGCYFADDATLDALERDGQVLFRYAMPDGSPASGNAALVGAARMLVTGCDPARADRDDAASGG